MKKRLIIGLWACLFLLSSCAIGSTTATTTIKVGTNQELIIGRITAIYGNEVTLALARESAANTGTKSNTNVTRSAGETVSGTDTSASQGANAGNRTRPSGAGGGSGSGGTMPAGSDSSGRSSRSGGTMPSGGQYPGGTMPSGGQYPGRNSQNTQSGQTAASGSNNASKSTAAVVTYLLTGESLTTTIPVGTDVTTQLGAITTFSRLAVGDTVKVLMEKDAAGKQIPVAVWIVG